MAFEYCCFISYPHGQDEVLVSIVDDFVQGLKREIGAQDRRPLWFDQVLTGGRRIDEASRYVALDWLGISPQCGFASSVGGNPLTIDDQRRKLARVVEVAELVWG